MYMRANSPMRLQDNGALISASQLVVNTKDTVENTGTLLGDAIVISADTLQQGGHIRAKTLGVTTIGDIVTTGTIDATDTVQLLAGQDIRMNNTITHLQNQDILTSMAGIAVSGDEGVLLLSANRDVKLAGATLSAMGYFSGYDYAYGYRTRMERGYGGRTILWSVESQEMANPGTSPDTVFDGYSFRNSYDIMALLKNAGSISSNGYVIDKSGREHTELGLVGDYLLNRKLATLVYSNDGVGYARSQWGDIVTSKRYFANQEIRNAYATDITNETNSDG